MYVLIHHLLSGVEMKKIDHSVASPDEIVAELQRRTGLRCATALDWASWFLNENMDAEGHEKNSITTVLRIRNAEDRALEKIKNRDNGVN